MLLNGHLYGVPVVIRQDTVDFELLDVLEFTSERKRMSVIVRTQEGRILLMCKGADSVICDRLAPHQPYLDQTITHLEGFAHRGFRTLCVATAEIVPDFYSEWKKQFTAACVAMDKRKEKVGCRQLFRVRTSFIGSGLRRD